MSNRRSHLSQQSARLSGKRNLKPEPQPEIEAIFSETPDWLLTMRRRMGTRWRPSCMSCDT
jgi:hypothetical protein